MAQSDPQKVLEAITGYPGDALQVVRFTKRTNGESRLMQFRLTTPEEVLKEREAKRKEKGDSGGSGNNGRTWGPVEKKLLKVWDLEKQDHRHIPLDAVEFVVQRGEMVYEAPETREES